MPSNSPYGHDRPQQPSIPLQDFSAPSSPNGSGAQQRSRSNTQQQHLDPVTPHSPSPRPSHDATHLPRISTYWDQPYDAHYDNRLDPGPSIDPAALTAAMPPEFRASITEPADDLSSTAGDPYSSPPLYSDEMPPQIIVESDRVPLTSRAEPISGSLSADLPASARDSFQTLSDIDNASHRGRDTLRPSDVELGRQSTRQRRYGMSLNPSDYISRRPSSALLRAGDMVRAMSQRVVNISGDTEAAEIAASRQRSRSPSRERSRSRSREPTPSAYIDTSYPSQTQRASAEKRDEPRFTASEVPLTLPRVPPPNPLKGRTLGLFGPNSRVRNFLCDVLVNAYTEPLILILIITQTVLLTMESAYSVFSVGHERPDRWGGRWMDWAILGLFIVFTLELIARTIVSGFILNAAEYSTIDRQKGIRAALGDQYRAIFQPQRHKSHHASVHAAPQEPSAISRSFTTFMQAQHGMPVPRTFEEQQRFQLARRAFLRHSFNRLDFVAVVAYWISFTLGVFGLESYYHIYVFKMLSCLRILRLLALTHGTSIILRSLKKAAPLLVRVGFLIGFFWLLFAIIGVQSFKASFRRQCLWLDPMDPQNLAKSYRHELGFCGGHIHNDSDETVPWVKTSTEGSLVDLINGTKDAKGFICPRGSICLEQGNPFNGTVNFDNVIHSLELVFVIMGANTFSNLMYYTMGSDYSMSALFFGAGVMILTLWLVNLLIAVITSSFQVIREESKSSAFTGDDEWTPPPEEQPYRRIPTIQRYYSKSQPLWVIVITFGLVCQAFRSSEMSDNRRRLIDIAEVAVTFLLDLDMILRILVNWHDFHRSWRNLFDLVLALVTSIILIPPIRESPAYPWLTVFQILRAYRVVLAISVTRELIMLVLGNAAGIANLMMFVFLMTFLVAILACQLFRGEIPMNENGQLNRISFYHVYNSFLGVYQVLTTEGWTAILYSVTGYTTDKHTSWIGGAFLIGWFIVAFFILVNMFIAVIQENFDVSEDEKRLEQVRAFLQKRDVGSSSSNLALSTIFNLGRARQRKDPLDYGPAMTEMLLKDAVVREFLDDPAEAEHEPHPPQRSQTTLLGDARAGSLAKLWQKLVRRFVKREPNPFYTSINWGTLTDTLDARQMAQQAMSAAMARRKAQREYLARHPTYNNSLYIFTPKNPIRRLCQSIVGPARGTERVDGVEPNRFAWYTFSAFVYASIVGMVVIACITTPLYQKLYQEDNNYQHLNWYVWTDVAFAVVFTVEGVIKIIADGLINTPNAFLRSSWGIVDAVVLVTLWINVVTLLVNNGTVSRAIGAFKALRALRLLNVSNSARDTFHSLIIVGWWKLFGAAFISISLLIPFAIYGLNLFHSKMVFCNDGSGITLLEDCFGEFNSSPYRQDWPFLVPRVAANPYFSFDDFASSLFTLFQIVGQEGWTDVSFASQAITGIGRQPQDSAAEGNAMFFVVFNILATVFILTLFISVFMRNYTEQTGVAYLTAEQRSWLELRKMLRHISPSKSAYDDSGKQTWKRWCHKRAIEKRGRWYQAVTLVLVLHLGLLMVEFSDEPESWGRIRSSLFLVFTLVYMTNMAVRIIGLGWSRFRRSAWDMYSIVTVTGAFLSTTAVLTIGNERETAVQVHKFFLVGIVLLVIPRNDALDQLFKTAAASLTMIGNLLATWLVLFLVFAIAFTQAFSLTRFGQAGASDINFRTVPKALILLFRMSFGEGWNNVMEDYAGIEPPLCIDDDNFFLSDCGGKPWARFLFIAWNILSMYIFVNLFVSLIYESFSYVYQRSMWVAAVDRDEIRRFKEAWRSVDPAGTGAISKETFPRLLSELSGVFQMRIYDQEDSVHSILDDVQKDVGGGGGGLTGAQRRHMSIASVSGGGMSGGGYGDIDLDKLNRRIARLDVEQIRKRRRDFNLFYEEVLVTADPDRGITFTSVLMILAHYNIINDSKSLKLDEFLRRRARLQRVDDSVRRKTVQGFFDTLYWTRRFKKHIEFRKSARMTTIPQLDIPDILVDDGTTDDDESTIINNNRGATNIVSQHLSLLPPSSHLSVSSQGPSRPTSSDNITSSWEQHHPLSMPPRSSSTTPSPPMSPNHNTLGFNLVVSDNSNNSDAGGGGVGGAEMTRRRGSSVSPNQAREMLDDSAWMDSIRRSTTMGRRSHHGGL